MSRKRFIVILENPTSDEQNNGFITWIESHGLNWWHWVGDSWLIVGHTTLSAGDVRDRVKIVFGMRNFVQEISGTYGSWAGYGPKGTTDKTNMFNWLDANWWG